MSRILLWSPIVTTIFGILFTSTLAAAPTVKNESAVEISERYRSLETLARGLFYLETMYFDPEKVEQDDLVHNALKGIVDQLDPHTMLMPRKAFDS